MLDAISVIATAGVIALGWFLGRVSVAPPKTRVPFYVTGGIAASDFVPCLATFPKTTRDLVIDSVEVALAGQLSSDELYLVSLSVGEKLIADFGQSPAKLPGSLGAGTLWRAGEPLTLYGMNSSRTPCVHASILVRCHYFEA